MRPLKKNAGRAGLAGLVVLVLTSSWILLSRSDRPPGWLRVEAPAVAIADQPFEIRVTLESPADGMRLVSTLHRAGSDRRMREFIAGAGPAREVRGGGPYEFRFDIPRRPDVAFVSVVIYLSPTGRWRDRARAAHTRLVPVRPAGGGPASGLARLRVYSSTSAADDAIAAAAARRPKREPSPLVHPVLGLILLAAGSASLLNSSRARREAAPENRLEASFWLAFALAFVASAFFEISGLVGHIASLARRLAEENSLYEFRRPVQKALLSATAAGAAALVLLYVKERKRAVASRHLWVAGLGLAVYLAVAFAGALSFHAVDVVRGLVVWGISPVDAARGVGAALALIAAAAAFGAGRRPPHL